ncbi:hypothetical protein [Brevibacillus dissolubilis]|uniref:hypothetical protein n=1 Tax=Brevibacillus dissolubilis TaxID=1844116 RepID=UPI0011175B6F|nr:hypothetical protein [Brevibacillus dissolubilis]
MFYHGIKKEYVYQHYPILSPRRSVSKKDKEQLQDRQHLIEKFGCEPIHLLEESPDYPRVRCVVECLHFGDTVFAFSRLSDPLWQLSKHEVGVPILDLNEAVAIYLTSNDLQLRTLFGNIPIFLVKSSQIVKKSCMIQLSTL